MSEFAAIIKYQFEGEAVSTVVLDTINSDTVQSNTTVTSQPVVSGDEISDHQFKLPKTLTLSGTCSINGSQGIVIDGTGSRLANFQELFERIQNEGVLCDIYRISINNENDIRFKQRSNMVLESATWTQNINSLDFSMTFKQVLIADVVEYDVDIDDQYAPNVTEPATTSFTNALIDWSQIDNAIIGILDKESLWTTEFKNFISAATPEFLKGLGISLVAAAAVLAICAASGPVGWIAGVAIIAVAAVAGIVKGIINIFSESKKRRKYAIKMFEYYKNSKKNEQEAERFADFIYSIHQDLESINNKLSVYQISTNEPQEAMINVGDDYYIFTFTKNNVNGKYSCSIENVDKTKTKDISDITSSPESMDQLTSSNYLIKATNNSRIYLMCPAENKDELTNYFILVCDFNPDDYRKMITEVIENHIYRDAQST